MRGEWKTRPLGDVCRVIGGGTPSKGRPEFYGGTIPWATVGDMQVEMLSSTVSRITEDAVGKSATNVIPAGSVVIATRVGLGKVCMLGQDTAINQDLRGIIPLNRLQVSERYLFWWFKSIADCIVAEGTGATVQGVKVPFVKALSVPVPPPAEQQRIVGILDEAFEGIATAKANVEENVRNAHALFESHLQSVFTQLRGGWSERALGDLATFRNGINFTKSSRGESVRIVGVKDFRSGFWAPLDNLDTVTTDGALTDADVLREDDLLFVRSNGNIALIGRSLLVGEVREKTAHSGFTIRARLNAGGPSPRFLCHFAKSSEARRQMIAGGTGTNIKSLSQSTLSALVVPIPPISEQSRIMCQVEAMDAEAQRLGAIYQRKLAALDELKKSLLHQAFAGKL